MSGPPSCTSRTTSSLLGREPGEDRASPSLPARRSVPDRGAAIRILGGVAAPRLSRKPRTLKVSFCSSTRSPVSAFRRSAARRASSSRALDGMSIQRSTMISEEVQKTISEQTGHRRRPVAATSSPSHQGRGSRRGCTSSAKERQSACRRQRGARVEEPSVPSDSERREVGLTPTRIID